MQHLYKKFSQIKAEVTLYHSEKGGRTGPTPEVQFSCPIEFQGNLYDCRMYFESKKGISPGETGVVEIGFLRWDLLEGKLKKNSKFKIWEGGIIGSGVVVAELEN